MIEKLRSALVSAYHTIKFFIRGQQDTQNEARVLPHVRPNYLSCQLAMAFNQM